MSDSGLRKRGKGRSSPGGAGGKGGAAGADGADGAKGGGELRIHVDGSSKSLGRRFLQALFIAWMAHYLIWAPGLFFVAGYLLYLGGPSFWFVGCAVGLLYLRSFLQPYQYKLGRHWPAFTEWLLPWHLGHEYYDLTVVRTAPLDADKQYVFGFSPHGIMLASRLAIYGGLWTKLFPGIEQRCLAARPMFYCAGSREIGLWTGGVDAGKGAANNVMRAGMSLLVYPGGSREIHTTHPDSDDTTVLLRKGFMRVAMRHGASLVPTFIFGEKWLYGVLTPPAWLRDAFLAIKLPLLIFWGRFFTLLPRRRPLAVVYGAPIAVPHLSEPAKDASDEAKAAYDAAVDEVFEQYRAALVALYDKHRDEFGYPKSDRLVVVTA